MVEAGRVQGNGDDWGEWMSHTQLGLSGSPCACTQCDSLYVHSHMKAAASACPPFYVLADFMYRDFRT